METCRYTPVRTGFGGLARGYMGTAVMHVHDMGNVVYFTDLAHNRAVAADVPSRPDLAGQLGVTLYDGLPIFSWGVVADDLDRDGNDDLLVAQGQPNRARCLSIRYTLTQRCSSCRAASPPTPKGGKRPRPSTTAGTKSTATQRAMIRTDIDGSYMDLFNTALEGVRMLLSTSQRWPPPAAR